MPSTPQKAGKIIDASFQRLYDIAKPDFERPIKPEQLSWTSFKLNFRCLSDMLVSILQPAYCRIHELYLRTTTKHKGSEIIIALRRYKNKTGRWPESLDEIRDLAPAEVFVDPINGDSFVYKLTEENFTLYSKGKNNIDENGKYDADQYINLRGGFPFEEVREDDRLIWPPCNDKK